MGGPVCHAQPALGRRPWQADRDSGRVSCGARSLASVTGAHELPCWPDHIARQDSARRGVAVVDNSARLETSVTARGLWSLCETVHADLLAILGAQASRVESSLAPGPGRSKAMRFAKIVFVAAGVLGIVVLTPLYF